MFLLVLFELKITILVCLKINTIPNVTCWAKDETMFYFRLNKYFQIFIYFNEIGQVNTNTKYQ